MKPEQYSPSLDHQDYENLSACLGEKPDLRGVVCRNPRAQLILSLLPFAGLTLERRTQTKDRLGSSADYLLEMSEHYIGRDADPLSITAVVRIANIYRLGSDPKTDPPLLWFEVRVDLNNEHSEREFPVDKDGLYESHKISCWIPAETPTADVPLRAYAITGVMAAIAAGIVPENDECLGDVSLDGGKGFSQSVRARRDTDRELCAHA